jgi:hypothetical protein
MYKGLPDMCYSTIEETEETIILKKGIDGYFPSINQNSSDELNMEIGVTKQQEQAMLIGSMFGWDVPGANPEIYNGDIRIEK